MMADALFSNDTTVCVRYMPALIFLYHTILNLAFLFLALRAPAKLRPVELEPALVCEEDSGFLQLSQISPY